VIVDTMTCLITFVEDVFWGTYRREIEREALHSSPTGGDHGHPPTPHSDQRRRHATCPPIRASLPSKWSTGRRESTPTPTWITTEGCFMLLPVSSWWFFHMEVNPSSICLFLVLICVLSVVDHIGEIRDMFWSSWSYPDATWVSFHWLSIYK
jgi:hypothetical protein